MAKKIDFSSGYVYSTDPNFETKKREESTGEVNDISAQKIRISLQTKHRAGKAVTIVNNFEGNLAAREELGKILKSYCGTGGAVKEDEIMIQGDQREKVLQWFLKTGYKMAKKM